MSSWLAITLIIYAALLFNQHGDEVHSTSGIADFIKDNKLTQREIIVYNELLPSLSFELDKMIVSVYADKRSLRITPYTNNIDEPIRLKIQNKVGDSTCLFFSLIHH